MQPVALQMANGGISSQARAKIKGRDFEIQKGEGELEVQKGYPIACLHSSKLHSNHFSLQRRKSIMQPVALQMANGGISSNSPLIYPSSSEARA